MDQSQSCSCWSQVTLNLRVSIYLNFFIRLIPLALISSLCFSILYSFLQRMSSFIFLLYFSCSRLILYSNLCSNAFFSSSSTSSSISLCWLPICSFIILVISFMSQFYTIASVLICLHFFRILYSFTWSDWLTPYFEQLGQYAKYLGLLFGRKYSDYDLFSELQELLLTRIRSASTVPLSSSDDLLRMEWIFFRQLDRLLSEYINELLGLLSFEEYLKGTAMFIAYDYCFEPKLRVAFYYQGFTSTSVIALFLLIKEGRILSLSFSLANSLGQGAALWPKQQQKPYFIYLSEAMYSIFSFLLIATQLRVWGYGQSFDRFSIFISHRLCNSKKKAFIQVLSLTRASLLGHQTVFWTENDLDLETGFIVQIK